MTKKKVDQEVVTAFKGFDKNLQCRGYQFEVGETFTHEGEVEACLSGFHACEYPLDVFSYYPPAQSRFALVKASGQVSRGDDTKIASGSINIEVEISIPQMVSHAIDWITNRLDKTNAQTNTGYRSAASNTGDYSAASNTGNQSAASNTGNQSAASNTGYRSAASNTGDYSAASNTGNQSAASNAGYRSAASNTGDYSAASNTGDYSAASNTGYRSAASNTGYRSAASNTGGYSAASNTGYRSAASNTGDYSAAEVSGLQAVAASFGVEGRARASIGGAIVLCHRNELGELLHIRAAKVGDDGVEPDVWYTLSASCEFVRVETPKE